MSTISIKLPNVNNPFKHKHLTLAQGYIGIHEQAEDGKDNPTILEFFNATQMSPSVDEVPWCAAFVNWILRECGYEYTGKPNARSFLEWGIAVPKHKVKVGDVGVITYGTWQGHVGFVQEIKRNGSIVFLSGNEGDAVALKTYELADFEEFRRLRKVADSTTVKTAVVVGTAAVVPTLAQSLGVSPETIEFVQNFITVETWEQTQSLLIGVGTAYIAGRKMYKTRSNRA